MVISDVSHVRSDRFGEPTPSESLGTAVVSVSRSRKLCHGGTRDRGALRSEILGLRASTQPGRHQTSRAAGKFARSSTLPRDIGAGVGCSDGGDPLPVDLYYE